jgi:hypothetical protein
VAASVSSRPYIGLWHKRRILKERRIYTLMCIPVKGVDTGDTLKEGGRVRSNERSVSLLDPSGAREFTRPLTSSRDAAILLGRVRRNVYKEGSHYGGAKSRG